MNYTDLFDEHGTFAKTERLTLRRVRENDRSSFVKLLNEESRNMVSGMVSLSRDVDEELKDCYAQNDEFVTQAMNCLGINQIILSVEYTESNTFCGYVQLKNVDTEIPEIVVNIAKDYQNKGIAYESICELISKTRSLTDIMSYIAFVDAKNQNGLKLMKKLNAEENEDLVRVRYGEMYDQSIQLKKMVMEKYGDDENNPLLPLLKQLTTLPYGFIIR